MRCIKWLKSSGLFPFLLPAVCITAIAACQPALPPNQVITIIDGDSFILRNQDGSEQRIDLAHVDAPEREQPFGREAKRFLEQQLLNKTITLSEDNTVLVDNQNLNLLLLQNGFAWHRPETSSPEAATFESQFAYNEAQTEAMNNLKGLWGLEHGLRVPPWVWRQQATERSVNPMQKKRMMEQKFKAMTEKPVSENPLKKNLQGQDSNSDKQHTDDEKTSGEDQ